MSSNRDNNDDPHFLARLDTIADDCAHEMKEYFDETITQECTCSNYSLKPVCYITVLDNWQYV